MEFNISAIIEEIQRHTKKLRQRFESDIGKVLAREESVTPASERGLSLLPLNSKTLRKELIFRSWNYSRAIKD
jgi:hypothetical protein